MKLNKVQCAESYGNTGFGDCFFDPEKIVGAFLVPKTASLSAADIATLQATLQTKMTAAKAQRFYPIHNFAGMTDGSEDIVKTTLGYGAQAVTREGFNNWLFEFTNGGQQLLEALRKFNGRGKCVLFYDSKGQLFGYSPDKVSIKGIPLEYFWAKPWKVNDGSNATKYFVEFCFDPKFVNDQLGFVQTDFDLSGLEGVQDVILEVASNVAGVVKVTATTKISNVNLFEAGFDVELAAVGAWEAKEEETGTAIVISTVEEDAAIKGFTLTLDNAAYAALPAGTKIAINLKDATALAALNVAPYESFGPVVITKA